MLIRGQVASSLPAHPSGSRAGRRRSGAVPYLNSNAMITPSPEGSSPRRLNPAEVSPTKNRGLFRVAHLHRNRIESQARTLRQSLIEEPSAKDGAIDMPPKAHI